MSKWLKRLLQGVGLLIGFGLFMHVLSQAKPAELMRFLSNLSAYSWFLLFFYFFPYCLDTWGWIFVFGKKWQAKVRYWPLSLIRLEGEAINMITPGIDVGGEPLKIALTAQKYKIPKKILVSSMFIHRTLFLVTALPFISIGLLLFYFYVPGYMELKLYFVYGLLLYAGITGVFIFLQQKNLFLKKPAYLGKEISKLYKQESILIIKAGLLHFASWLCNAAEAYLMLRVAGVPVTFIQALMLESLVQLIRTASCFIPGSLGAQESAYAYLAQVLGFPGEAGLAISLFKRARQIVWMLFGFSIWGRRHAILFRHEHTIHKNCARRASLP